MNFSSAKGPVTKFYQQDVVQKITAPHSIGIVLRCWHDAEDAPLPNPLQDPLMRSLERGEVGVSFLSEPTDKREILPESDLHLLDRSLQPGDVVKRSVDDLHSGMILDVRLKTRLEHAISKAQVDGWKTLEDLDTDRQAEIEDYVVYEDWVGQVIELYDENIIELEKRARTSCPRLLEEFRTCSDICSGPIALLLLIKQHKHGGKSATTPTILARVRYRQTNLEGIPVTKHGQEGEAGGVITVNSFNVTATDTEVDVLWQDGNKETLRSVDLIPYMNPDEYDCWPGDHVFFIGDGGGTQAIPGVVQTVDAIQRTATILLRGKIEQVSLLELDSQGASDSISSPEIGGLGVRRGEMVFIHAPGKNNGFEAPRVPKIGELEPWVRANPFTLSGQLSGWREELATIGADIATRRSLETIDEGIINPKALPGTLSWFGEVIDLRLDGSLDVLHPDGSLGTYPLERVTRLYDGIEQLEDELYEDEEGSENQHQMHGIWDYDYHWGNGESQNSGDGYEDEEMREPDVEQSSEHTTTDTIASMSPPSDPPTELITLDSTKSELEEEGEMQTQESDQNANWEKFKILSSAPQDHAYYQTSAAQPSRQFMSRLNREYRVLMNSLPENILVRAYEDRADLVRSLIIGPSNTPYQDCPFVIDWHLVDYPNTAPLAHFHSLTNGNGRVNPNLYEEGKVCLSILNTWAGDRNESWDASRSSLLQALVSIQGLVLVQEPWFCEPAYEKLRGTEEGTVNSRLYSEKAYVLSRNFVRRTLETPFGGLEMEINWLQAVNNYQKAKWRNKPNNM
ncbi:ubiquitin-conjugating enzyme3 like-protein [Lentinula edodes]|uniref:Ubiquitin-conjugating enzyme3 like-protein n=1 Tax=Lentinula edodes TaxID=5353 RepID=A0A1Q3EB18_LENED|nr:ubiquitin-conjugating enzyme3 like-protein [Lentinula edodes]